MCVSGGGGSERRFATCFGWTGGFRTGFSEVGFSLPVCACVSTCPIQIHPVPRLSVNGSREINLSFPLGDAATLKDPFSSVLQGLQQNISSAMPRS